MTSEYLRSIDTAAGLSRGGGCRNRGLQPLPGLVSNWGRGTRGRFAPRANTCHASGVLATGG